MPSKEIITKIGGQNLKLTNLDKVLFPTLGYVKAEFIQYHMEVSQYILPHLTQRPMTFIRYPDGVDGKRFYSKNKPKWTPDWINSIKTDPEDDNQYVLINGLAELIWAANLASLELHPMQVKAGALTKPDHFIFDLDPPPDSDFEVVKELALNLKTFLESYDYHPFVKTSGSKGLHIYVPITAIYEQSVVFEAIKSLAKTFIKDHPETTLVLNKKKRLGRVLLDIFRNHKSQTCVAPFSTRGKHGAPVSMPIWWDEVEALDNSQAYNIKTVLPKIKERGNPWNDFYERSASLHNQKKSHVVSNKVKESLKTYDAKRDFKKTDEPSSKSSSEKIEGINNFVIQMHDASNLHYDLRLQEDGVLKSWAIPKGLPEFEGVKRLAIQTEDHPLKYLNFEGVIPKDEYGGGTMWVFDTGKYEATKKKAKSYKLTLHGKYIKGEFSLFHTKEKQWLIERKSPSVEIKEDAYSPMLASQVIGVPSPAKYFFEIKWDGIRVKVIKVGKEVKIISRNGREITKQFPLIVKSLMDFEAYTAVIDGEIVVLDDSGKPMFNKVISRLHTGGKAKIDKLAVSLAACLYAFDLCYLDGRSIIKEPIEKRREWLDVNFKTNTYLRFSNSFEDGEALFEAAKTHGLEGIMCKKKGGKYEVGKRSKSWLKVKVRSDDEAFIIGYTKGQGDRVKVFGALHLAKIDEEGDWRYMGKVGTGFDSKLLKSIFKKLSALEVTKKPVKDQIDEEYNTVWVTPKLECKIQYASMTANDTYREPVFMGFV